MKRFIPVVTLILMLLPARPVPAQFAVEEGWVQLANPQVEGGAIYAMDISLADPSRLYALMEGQAEFYASTDGSQTWHGKPGIAGGYIAAKADVDLPSTLYLLSTDAVLWRSDDGGNTFTKKLDQVASIAVAAGGRIYAGMKESWGSASCVSSFQLYRSNDRGDNWSGPINVCISHPKLILLPSKPDTIYLTSFEKESELILRSTDGGNTWVNLSPTCSGYPCVVYDFYIDPLNPQRLISQDYNDLRMSTDGGFTWSGNTTIPEVVSVIRSGESLILASILNISYRPKIAVYRSTDNGISWWKALQPLPTCCVFLFADPRVPGHLFAATRGYGVWKSDDYGADWQEANDGLNTNLETQFLAASRSNPNVLYAASNYPHPAVLKSEDGGQSWKATPIELNPFGAPFVDFTITSVSVSPIHPDNAYLGTTEGLYAIYPQPPDQVVWKEISHYDVFSINDLSFGNDSDETLCAAAHLRDEAGVFCNNVIDEGYKLFYFYAIPAASEIQTVAIDPTNPKHIYAGGNFQHSDTDDGTGVMVSDDGGLTWHEILYWPIRQSVESKLSISFYNSQWIGFNNGAIFLSDNSGKAWMKFEILPIAPKIPTAVAFDALGNRYFLGVDGLYQMPVGKSAWEIYAFHSFDLWDAFSALDLNPGNVVDRLYVRNRNGIYRQDLPHYRVVLPVLFH